MGRLTVLVACYSFGAANAATQLAVGTPFRGPFLDRPTWPWRDEPSAAVAAFTGRFSDCNYVVSVDESISERDLTWGLEGDRLYVERLGDPESAIALKSRLVSSIPTACGSTIVSHQFLPSERQLILRFGTATEEYGAPVFEKPLFERTLIEPNVVETGLLRAAPEAVLAGPALLEEPLPVGTPFTLSESSLLSLLLTKSDLKFGLGPNVELLSGIVPESILQRAVVGEVERPLVEPALIERPVVERPLIERPVVERPLVERPVVERPLVERPVVERPLVERPIVERPLVERPIVERPLVERPIVERPLVERPIVERPLVERPLLERPVVERPVVERPLLERPVVERPIVERPIVERPLIESPLVERPLVERPIVERPYIEEPFIERPLVEEFDMVVEEKPWWERYIATGGEIVERPLIERPLAVEGSLIEWSPPFETSVAPLFESGREFVEEPLRPALPIPVAEPVVEAAVARAEVPSWVTEIKDPWWRKYEISEVQEGFPTRAARRPVAASVPVTLPRAEPVTLGPFTEGLAPLPAVTETGWRKSISVVPPVAEEVIERPAFSAWYDRRSATPVEKIVEPALFSPIVETVVEEVVEAPLKEVVERPAIPAWLARYFTGPVDEVVEPIVGRAVVEPPVIEPIVEHVGEPVLERPAVVKTRPFSERFVSPAPVAAIEEPAAFGLRRYVASEALARPIGEIAEGGIPLPILGRDAAVPALTTVPIRAPVVAEAAVVPIVEEALPEVVERPAIPDWLAKYFRGPVDEVVEPIVGRSVVEPPVIEPIIDRLGEPVVEGPTVFSPGLRRYVASEALTSPVGEIAEGGIPLPILGRDAAVPALTTIPIGAPVVAEAAVVPIVEEALPEVVERPAIPDWLAKYFRGPVDEVVEPIVGRSVVEPPVIEPIIDRLGEPVVGNPTVLSPGLRRYVTSEALLRPIGEIAEGAIPLPILGRDAAVPALTTFPAEVPIVEAPVGVPVVDMPLSEIVERPAVPDWLAKYFRGPVDEVMEPVVGPSVIEPPVLQPILERTSPRWRALDVVSVGEIEELIEEPYIPPVLELQPVVETVLVDGSAGEPLVPGVTPPWLPRIPRPPVEKIIDRPMSPAVIEPIAEPIFAKPFSPGTLVDPVVAPFVESLQLPLRRLDVVSVGEIEELIEEPYIPPVLELEPVVETVLVDGSAGEPLVPGVTPPWLPRVPRPPVEKIVDRPMSPAVIEPIAGPIFAKPFSPGTLVDPVVAPFVESLQLPLRRLDVVSVSEIEELIEEPYIPPVLELQPVVETVLVDGSAGEPLVPGVTPPWLPRVPRPPVEKIVDQPFHSAVIEPIVEPIFSKTFPSTFVEPDTEPFLSGFEGFRREIRGLLRAPVFEPAVRAGPSAVQMGPILEAGLVGGPAGEVIQPGITPPWLPRIPRPPVEEIIDRPLGAPMIEPITGPIFETALQPNFGTFVESPFAERVSSIAGPVREAAAGFGEAPARLAPRIRVRPSSLRLNSPVIATAHPAVVETGWPEFLKWLTDDGAIVTD